MDTKLQEFIAEYQDQPNVGTTPENTGQCVGLSEKWIHNLGLPAVWGNAKDLLADADTSKFDVVSNSPDNFPVVGDVVVFGTNYGGGLGHTGICISADPTTLTLFEQNDPQGSYPHTQEYGYGTTSDDCLGWLHPKVAEPAQAATAETPTDNTYKGLDLTNLDSVKAAIDAWSDVANGLYVKKEEYTALETKYVDLENKYNALTQQHSEVQTTIAAQTQESVTQRIIDFLKTL